MEEALLSVREIAKRLKVSRSFAYRILEVGTLPVVRIGKSVRVRPEDLREFIKCGGCERVPRLTRKESRS